jgi:methylglutaconyl-CoA hydratase
MSDKNIIIELNEAGIATVILNRPEKHNAFDENIIAELIHAFESLAKNANVRVMILAAHGKSFSAGADLAWMQRIAAYSYEENIRDAQALAKMLKTLNEMPMPTIARVHGAAFGGAVGLVSCCDIAVGTAKASFSLSEVKIGLVPATISPYVIQAIGERACRRYFQTAERFDASKAEQLQLLSMVVEENELDVVINQLCTSILANGPLAMAKAKQLIFDVAGKPLTEELIQHTCELIAEVRVSDEGQEGLKAFFEKRPKES